MGERLDDRESGLGEPVLHPAVLAGKQAVVTEVLGRLPAIDILVTSAGVYGEPLPIEDMDDAEMDRVLGVNVKGTLWTVRGALPHLRRSRGRIVCLGSLAGKVGGVAAGPQYVASKGAIHALVKSLARTEAAFLASPGASYLTGAIVDVNGGVTTG